MATEEDILREQEAENSPLAHFPRAMPFAVPENYFEDLAAQIIVAANEKTPSFLTGKREMPFALEPDYFETFTATLLPKIAAQEANPYQVPPGYFDVLPEQILKAVKKEEQVVTKTKVIAFNPKRIILRWAAAAVLIIGSGLGTYQFLYKTPDQLAAHQLSKVDPEIINEYAMLNIDDFDAETLENNFTPAKDASFNLKQVDKKDIDQYLEETSDKTNQ